MPLIKFLFFDSNSINIPRLDALILKILFERTEVIDFLRKIEPKNDNLRISKSNEIKPEILQQQLDEISTIWNIPESQPTFDGMITPEQAEILALNNQHKLRFDTEINDYRVPRVHLYNGELGTGTLYARNKAF